MERKATNIVWHEHKVKREEREKLLGQKSVILWFTGLPSSGKSTIANEVSWKLYQLKKLSYVLDGDNIRHGLNSNLGFSPEDRQENIRRIGEVAKLFMDAGFIVLTAFISPYKKDRDRVRSIVPDGKFIEVYVKTPLEVCEERDPKGLYKKARAGEIKDFTGVSAPYEEPENPEIILETDRLSVEECAEKVIDYLKNKNYI